MPNNHGRLKEDEMMINLNGKKVSEITPNLFHMMEELFGALEPNEVITCTQPEDYIKPDLLITYKGITKGISMKSSTSENVHTEYVSTFIDFLESIGVSKETRDTILLYHFGDGTKDGTGSNRMSLDEVRFRYRDLIKKANTELNEDPEIITKIVDRLVFDGVNPNAAKADALYHGDIYYGIVITRKQVHKHILRKVWDKYDNLHVGPLFLRAHARYVGVEVRNEKYHQHIDAKWARLIADMEYISKRYFSYTPLNKRTFAE